MYLANHLDMLTSAYVREVKSSEFARVFGFGSLTGLLCTALVAKL